MADKNYELIEHTADIGIRVRGEDLKELFRNAALAMFDIIAEKLTADSCPCLAGRQELTPGKKIAIQQEADNLEELFVNWLNELLSLSATEEKIFCDFEFKNLNERNLGASVGGGNLKEYKINSEIKAATYHGLKIEKTKIGWQAEVIFDV
jgi:SHS2 domain-containing protein